MNITSGKIAKPQKVVVYGPEGIGKSTFASMFPNPVYIDTEGSTVHLDVNRTDKPSSWTMLIQQVMYFKNNQNLFDTLIIDTADWAEDLCSANVCSVYGKKGIEEFGYGKGYTYLEEEWGKFLNLLQDIIDVGMNVVITAHAIMRKFEQPDEQGAYDRWELKLQKKTAPLLKEWADTILFANYKTIVVNVDGQGAQKGKNKAQGGKRVMYTQHHPCWDAKNRWGLPEELPFEYAQIEKHIPKRQAQAKAQETKIQEKIVQQENIQEKIVSAPEEKTNNIPKELLDLMRLNDITETEIRMAVSNKGYYTYDTPIENYDPNFINGVLIGAWAQVFNMIKDSKKQQIEMFTPVTDADEIPFKN